MTNNERFNQMLNNCQNPRAVYNAPQALAPVICEARSAFPDRFAGKSDQEIINEIAAVVRRAENHPRPLSSTATQTERNTTQ